LIGLLLPLKQIMWMSTGMAPMMLPGGHQQLLGMGLNSSCVPPTTTQVLSRMQIAPPFMNNPLPNQMPGVSSAAASVANVANEAHRNSIAGPRNPFFDPSGAPAATPEVIVPISSLTPSFNEIPAQAHSRKKTIPQFLMSDFRPA
jgi:phytochrome-interacting factor 4